MAIAEQSARLRWGVVLAAAIGVAGCGKSDAKQTADSAVTVLPVSTVAADFQGSYGVTQQYSGKLVSRRAVELGFELDGKIATILVDEGDVVKAKQPLATLESTLLVAQRVRLTAGRDAATARLAELQQGPRAEAIEVARAQVAAEAAIAKLMDSQRKRVQRLLEKKTVSEEAYDDIDSRATAATKRLEAARHRLGELLAGTRPERIAAQKAVVRGLDATLVELEIRIRKSTLKSPFAGIVALRRAEEGAAVSAGHPILRVVENRPFEARISLPVAASRVLSKGGRHELVIGGRRYRAGVVSLLPELDPRTLNVSVVFEVEAEVSARLFAGQLVLLALPQEIDAAGAWLPTTSLVKGIRGLWSCFALVPAGDGLFRVERRDLEIVYAEVDRAFVRGTVQPNDRIVRTGTHRLSNGQLVKLLK